MGGDTVRQLDSENTIFSLFKIDSNLLPNKKTVRQLNSEIFRTPQLLIFQSRSFKFDIWKER